MIICDDINSRKKAILKTYCNNSSNIGLKSRFKHLQVFLTDPIKLSKEKDYHVIAGKLNNTHETKSKTIKLKISKNDQ